MKVTYYPDEDALYVKLSDAKVTQGKELDERRYINLGDNDEVVGIEFLYVSDQIDLSGIPQPVAQTVLRVLEEQKRIRVAV